MENQEPQTPNQNSQDPFLRQTTNEPVTPPQINQTAPTPDQQPGAFFVAPTTSPAPQPTMDSPYVQPSQPIFTNNPVKPKRSPLVVISIIVLALLVLAAAGYLLLTHNNKAANLAAKQATKSNQPSSGAASSTSSDIANEKSIAFGTTATDGTFQVKLLSTTLNPTVTGTQADSGTQYLEADFSVTTLANKNNYAFNMLYLPSIVPSGDTMGNIEFTPADSPSPTSPITFNAMPTKTVHLAGKTSMEGNSIPNDGSAKTVDVYALFEIKQGDQGQIVWQGNDGGNYHFETR